MYFNRSLRTGFQREGQSPIDRKIRLLEEISEGQSQRVRNLLHQPSPSSHTTTKHLPTTFIPTTSFDSYPETPKARYLYEDFLEEMKVREVQGSHRAALKDIQREPLLLPADMEVFQNRQLDQQMQYFKSEEYRQRLEQLAMENSHKAAYPRRKHQIYIKAPSRVPCRPYQMVQNSMGLNVSSRSPHRQAISPQNRPRMVQEMLHSPNYCLSMREQARLKRYEPKHEPGRVEPQQNPPLTPRNLLQYRQPKHYQKAEPLGLWERQSSSVSLHKQAKEKYCKSSTKIVNKKQNYSPSLQPIKTQHSTSIQQTRIETYRKQLQFCKRQQQRPKKQLKNHKSKKCYKYTGDIKIGSNKQNKNAQQRWSSRSSSPIQTAYEFSFKIERNPSKQPLNEGKPRPRPVSTYIQSTETYHCHKNKTPNYAHQATEPSRAYQKGALKESQTNSTATRPDGRCQKMSVVSRSRLK